MANNLDAAAAAAAGQAPRVNRQGARARQERWLAQLQEALFVADGDPGAGQRAHARRQQDAAADAARQPGPSGDACPQADGERGPQQAAATPAAGASADALFAVAPAAIANPVQAGVGGAAPAAVVASARGSLAEALPAAAEQAPSAPVASAAAAGKTGFGLASGTRGAAAQAESSQGAEAAAGGASAANEQEAYAPRLLRLQPGSEGVHAWLRDASLQPGQLAAVAAALAGELAAAGQPLSGLSVNGKPLPAAALRAATDQARRSAFHAYTAGAELAPVQPGKA